VENVLISKISIINNVQLIESKEIDKILSLIAEIKANDFFIIKNNETVKLYILNAQNINEKVFSCVKIEGVGVRSNLSLIPLTLKCIESYSPLIDLFINETTLHFIVNKDINENIINNIKACYREEGFDVIE
jgi:ankyrin repeat protein